MIAMNRLPSETFLESMQMEVITVSLSFRIPDTFTFSMICPRFMFYLISFNVSFTADPNFTVSPGWGVMSPTLPLPSKDTLYPSFSRM